MVGAADGEVTRTQVKRESKRWVEMSQEAKLGRDGFAINSHELSATFSIAKILRVT